MMKNYTQLLLIALLTATGSAASFAQQIRTAYFLDNAPVANLLNPSVMPERGYITIPAIGSTGVSYLSNGFAPGNLIFNKNGENVSFMDDLVSPDEFMKNIKNYNSFNMDLQTSILGAGWHMGKGFMTVGWAVKVNIDAGLPREMFEFMKLGTDLASNYSIKDFRLKTESYTEFAVGYARPVNSRLTIGGKMKFLIGVADVDMQIDQMSAVFDYDNNIYKWEVRSKGKFNASMKGLTMDISDDGYLTNFDFDKDNLGVGGYGAAIDLGVNYKISDKLRVSASVLDLGFISWGKKNNVSGRVDASNLGYFDGFDSGDKNAADQIGDILSDLEELFKFKPQSNKSRTTMLRATVYLGAEYSILNNLLGFGILSSTHIYQPRVYTEITTIANVRPIKWFSGALSYSFIHSKFKTFGIALNFHTSVVNFFLGSDYLIFNADHGIPKSMESANIHVGLNVALGRSKYCR